MDTKELSEVVKLAKEEYDKAKSYQNFKIIYDFSDYKERFQKMLNLLTENYSMIHSLAGLIQNTSKFDNYFKINCIITPSAGSSFLNKYSLSIYSDGTTTIKAVKEHDGKENDIISILKDEKKVYIKEVNCLEIEDIATYKKNMDSFKSKLNKFVISLEEIVYDIFDNLVYALEHRLKIADECIKELDNKAPSQENL